MSKTIKIIDLLNKIANGEEVPKRIKFYQRYYSWYDNRFSKGYCKEPLMADGNSFLEINSNYDLLKLVEIIEDEDINIQDIEETEIELDKYNTKFYKYNNNGATESGYGFNYSCNDIETREKINDLIKVVKKLDKEINKK